MPSATDGIEMYKRSLEVLHERKEATEHYWSYVKKMQKLTSRGC